MLLGENFGPPFLHAALFTLHSPFFTRGRWAALFTAPFSPAPATRPCSQPLFQTRPRSGRSDPYSQPLFRTRPLRPLVHSPFFARARCAPLFTAPFSGAPAERPCSQPLFRTRPLRPLFTAPFRPKAYSVLGLLAEKKPISYTLRKEKFLAQNIHMTIFFWPGDSLTPKSYTPPQQTFTLKLQ
jgi:hypothetical protein